MYRKTSIVSKVIGIIRKNKFVNQTRNVKVVIGVKEQTCLPDVKNL